MLQYSLHFLQEIWDNFVLCFEYGQGLTSTLGQTTTKIYLYICATFCVSNWA